MFQNRDDLDLFHRLRIVTRNQGVVVPGSGIDPDQFKCANPPEERVRVVFPGRFLFEKGIREFVEAARLLIEAGVKADFVLVGDVDEGNPSSVPRSEVDKWLAEGAVHHAGWQNDMRRVYDQANIVCLPSYREGCPRALLEAASAGRCLVTTDVPGCRDIVHHRSTGLLAPARDGQALAVTLREAIENRDLRIRLGEAARDHVRTSFSTRAVVSATFDVYRKLVGDRVGVAPDHAHPTR